MSDLNGAVSAAPTEFSDFIIGGGKIRVPTATLYVLEERTGDFDLLSPEQTQGEYVKTSLRILAFAVLTAEDRETEFEALALKWYKRVKIPETVDIIIGMSGWLQKSGLSSPGEAVATMENDGTGMSGPLSPNSLLTEFVPEISTGLKEAIPSDTTGF